MKTLKLFLIFAAVILFISACSQSAPQSNSVSTVPGAGKPNTPAPGQPPAPIDEAAAGKELYASKCTICHKDTGKGGKVTVEGKDLKPADLTSDKMKARSNEKLMTGISEGSPDDGMPAFNDKLTKDQIKLVVKYVRTLQGS